MSLENLESDKSSIGNPEGSEEYEKFYPEMQGEGYLPFLTQRAPQPSEESIEGEDYGEYPRELHGEEIWGPCEGAEYPGEEYLPELREEEAVEEEEETIEEKISLDSEYLKKVLGVPLTYALLDIAMKRPTDPIHYLGHFLARWRWNGQNKERQEDEVKQLTAEREAYIENVKEKERQEMLAREQKEEELRRAEKVESSIEEDALEEEEEEEEEETAAEDEEA